MLLLLITSFFIKHKAIGYLQKILFITFLALSLVVGYYIIFALLAYYIGIDKVINVLRKRFKVIGDNWITVLCLASLGGPMIIFLAFGNYLWAGIAGVLLIGVIYLAKNGIIEDAYMMAMEVMAIFAGETKEEDEV